MLAETRARARLLHALALTTTIVSVACGAPAPMPESPPAPLTAAVPAPPATISPPRDTPTRAPIACPNPDLTRASASDWGERITGYASHVTLGNQTALREAARPFAVYLLSMHKRIHPSFEDRYVAWLSQLPPADPQRVENAVARVEVVLDASGALADLGIVRSSGRPSFDAAALAAFACAAPFAPPPEAIRAADGRVYVQWEMSSKPELACSLIGARPYLLAQ